MLNEPPQPPGLDALRRLSAEVGADPEMVQGAGGNTSLKGNGEMWIKASGTWLARAEADDIFVPVLLEPLRRALGEQSLEAEKAQLFVPEERNPRGLRPSIETSVHALFDHAVVIHIHCVDTIALACRQDAQDAIGALLSGFNWSLIPYRRPGLPLARAIETHRAPGSDVLVLANHGLVVAAEDVEAARALLHRVRVRLAQPVRPAPAPDLERLVERAADTGYRLPEEALLHGLGTDDASCRIAASGSLYPDHVVFLGPGMAVAGPGETAAAVEARATSQGLRPPPILAFPGLGVLAHEAIDISALAMAGCIARVASRIPPDAALRYLSAHEVGELSSWDAEKYRRSLIGKTGGPG